MKKRLPRKTRAAFESAGEDTSAQKAAATREGQEVCAVVGSGFRQAGGRAATFRYFVNGVVFFGVFCVSNAFFDRLLPYPDIPIASQKLSYLALHGNEYDTLFIGSSRVNFQIVPSVFDKTLADQGVSSRSFNVGIMGMRPPEEGFFLEQVLRQPHQHLRWVIIELVSLEARAPKSRMGSARFVFWHDASRLRLLWTWCQAEWRVSGNHLTWATYWEPLFVWLGHTPAFLQKSTNVGRALFLVEKCFPRKRNTWSDLGRYHDGWTPSGSREVMSEPEEKQYQQSYDARLTQPAVYFNDPASDAATQAMQDLIVHSGATPIFLVPPMTSENHYCPPAAMRTNMIIWDFSDPQRYPELFVAANRLDYIHLNSVGSEVFSKILAQRFAELPR